MNHINESALRRVGTIEGGDNQHTAVVYKNTEWDEFLVKYYANGQELPEDTWSHEESMQDAVNTARAELRHMVKNGAPVVGETQPGLAGQVKSLANQFKSDRQANLKSTAAPVQHEIPVDVSNLKLKLQHLESQFDPKYKLSDDHGYWVKQHALEQEIARVKSMVKQQGGGIGFESVAENIDLWLKMRIVNGLITVKDLVEGRDIYGGAGHKDRIAVQRTMIGLMESGLDYEDAASSILEFFTHELNEVGPIMPTTGMTKPGQPPKPAPGAQTQQAVAPVSPAANVSISSNQAGTQQQQPQQPMTAQDAVNLEKDIVTKLNDPNVSKSFAELLAKVMQRK